MNEWERPELWKGLGDTTAHIITAFAALGVAFSKLKAKVKKQGRAKKRKPTTEELSKEIEQLAKDLQTHIDLHTHVLNSLGELVQAIGKRFSEWNAFNQSNQRFIQSSAQLGTNLTSAMTGLLKRVSALEAAAATSSVNDKPRSKLSAEERPPSKKKRGRIR